MPPDDLPGLDDDLADADSPSPEPGGLDNTNPPKLDASKPGEPLVPLDWSDAELDDWFLSNFGSPEGQRTWNNFESMVEVKFGPGARAWNLEDLETGFRAFESAGDAPTPLTKAALGNPVDIWHSLPNRIKTRFRRAYDEWRALEAADRVRHIHRFPGVPRWVFVGGGFGILGLVLVVGFGILSGDGDDVGVAAPSEVSVVETAPPSTEVIVEDTEAPAIAVDAPEPSLVVTGPDPADFVTITDAAVLVDLKDDTWLEVTLAAPWPPTNDVAWSLIVGVGIHLGPRIHIVQWTLHDGTTRGEAFIEGQLKAALDAEMWVTPDGMLVVKLAGTSPTGGLASSDLGPGPELLLYGQLWLEEASEIQQWDYTVAFGQITQATNPLPRPDWQLLETDFGPITLIIPDTSDS